MIWLSDVLKCDYETLGEWYRSRETYSKPLLGFGLLNNSNVVLGIYVSISSIANVTFKAMEILPLPSQLVDSSHRQSYVKVLETEASNFSPASFW